MTTLLIGLATTLAAALIALIAAAPAGNRRVDEIRDAHHSLEDENQLTAAHQACGGNAPIALPPWHCEAVQ